MTCPTCGTVSAAAATTCRACGAPLGAAGSPHALAVGAGLHGGDLLVEGVLGQGGFGITYRGRDRRLGRGVAIKEFFPQGCGRVGNAVRPGGGLDAEEFRRLRERFLEETRVLARFHHPGIVPVYSAFEENETAYAVMELLEGKSLAQLLEERGPLPEPEAVGYVEQVGAALAEVHAAGLLHRDLKPENVIVSPAGRATLIDFGTARAFSAESTRRMTTLLTPGYAPLEQYSQQARFGAFTDVYGLAATLYHLLTGQPPTPALDRIQGVELVPVRRLNPAVSEQTAGAVAAGLQMEVARRPQSVREFLRLLPGGPAARRPRPVPPPPPPRPPAPRQRRAAPPRRPPPPAPPEPTLVRTLAGHHNWVYSLAFSPGGGRLLSASQDNSAILWDPGRGDALHRLAGHTGAMLGFGGAVFSAAFSPDGRVAATGANDDAVRFWDSDTGQPLAVLPGASGNVNAVAFSPDGRWLAAGAERSRVELWDLAAGQRQAALEGHQLSVMTLAFHPGGRALASGSEDGTVLLWDLATGAPLATLAEHHGAVRAVAISPDGRLLASGGDDGLVLLWELEHGTARSFLQHRAAVRAVAFSPTGALLATAGDERTLRLWDPQAAAPGGRAFALVEAHAGSIAAVAFAPDGQTLATGSYDTTVRLWRVG
jgi:WD40 repeat protein